MAQSRHINIQVFGTIDDRKVWKSLSALSAMDLGKWIRAAIDAQIAAQSVQQNAQSAQCNAQSLAQIEAVQS